MKITLINLPTLGLKICNYNNSDIYLNNIYNRIMPASLARVASVIKEDLDDEVKIFDLRAIAPEKSEVYKEIHWEGYKIEARRFGGHFHEADEAIVSSDIIGISSHFTCESHIVKDFIRYAKERNPSVKIAIGGADTKARAKEYLEFGADFVFIGDIKPDALLNTNKGKRIIGPHTEPLRKLIHPAFELFNNMKLYTDSHDGPMPEGVFSPIGFLYFTRGCPRNCDFCESSRTCYETLDLEQSILMLKHYKKNGIKTLNIVDDNLFLQALNSREREKLIELFEEMKKMNFAWEFPNGLDIAMLLREGRTDDELFEAMFYRKESYGTMNGAFRLFFPIESFDERDKYVKLKPVEEHNKVLEKLCKNQIPEIAFGVIILPSANENTFTSIQKGYSKIRRIVKEKSEGKTKARYSILNLIPIAKYRNMKTKYSVHEFPELWNFYTPSYDGLHFSARELFEKRLKLTGQLDVKNYASMKEGKYAYG